MLTKASGGGGILFGITMKEGKSMKKLTILSIMISLFAFWGSKNGVNIVKAEEAVQEMRTSAMFFEHSDSRNLVYDDANPNEQSGELFEYYKNIVSLSIQNNKSPEPTGYIERIMIRDCTYTDENGVTTTPDEGIIFAYLLKSDDSTETTIYYNCVLYANVDKIYANPNSASMFDGFSRLESIDLSLLDMSKVTIAEYMFNGCKSLTSIDLSKCDASNIIDMNNMFQNCTKTKKIKLPFNGPNNVQDMTEMFYGCKSLIEIENLNRINTSNLIRMSSMFKLCESLAALDLSAFDTSSLEYMSGTFYGCKSLTTLDLSNFDTSNVIIITSLFQNCTNLETIKFSTKPNANNTQNVDFMFSGCTSLKKVDLSSFDFSKVKPHGSFYPAFHNFFTDCTSLEYIKTPKLFPEGASYSPNPAMTLPSQFSECYEITELSTNNFSNYPAVCIPGEKFVNNWKAFRATGNNKGICAALPTDSANHSELIQLLADYDNLDADYQNYIDTSTDIEGVTVGESIRYLKSVLNGSQTTEENYGITNEDSGSYMITSIAEESSYLIAIITLLGVLAILGYYFYNKKKINLIK